MKLCVGVSEAAASFDGAARCCDWLHGNNSEECRGPGAPLLLMMQRARLFWGRPVFVLVHTHTVSGGGTSDDAGMQEFQEERQLPLSAGWRHTEQPVALGSHHPPTPLYQQSEKLLHATASNPPCLKAPHPPSTACLARRQLRRGPTGPCVCTCDTRSGARGRPSAHAQTISYVTMERCRCSACHRTAKTACSPSPLP